MNARPERPRLGERGSITPFVVIMALAILALAGLVIDGGRQLNAHGRAIAYAEEAARAGAQEIDVNDPQLDLDVSEAMQAASAYCTQAKSEDHQLTACDASPKRLNGPDGLTFTGVQVTTTIDIKPILLSIIDIHDLRVGGEALARPVTGITGPNAARQDDLPPPAVATPGGPEGPVEVAPPTNPGEDVDPCTTEKPDPDPPGGGQGGGGQGGGGQGGGGQGRRRPGRRSVERSQRRSLRAAH